MDRRGLDDRVRGLARATDEQVSRVAGSAGREALLEGIVQMPDTPGPAARRPRLRRPMVSALGAVALAGTAAIGWAVTRSPSSVDTTSVDCRIPGSESIIPSRSGDAVADCAAEWRRQTGAAPPPLVAYDNGHGGVSVAPASEPLPPGATRIPPGTAAQNVALIELQEALDDHVAGLAADCHDDTAATRLATAQLGRLGLTGWTVTPPAAPADGTATCVDTAVLDPVAHVVELRTGRFYPPDRTAPYFRLAEELRRIARGCRPLAETTALVEKAAAEVGLTEPTLQYQLTEVVSDRDCTTIHETVGGTVFVTLRGPAR